MDAGGGIHFEPASPGAHAAAVVELLESPRLADLGKAARERVVARWTNERLVDRHIGIYEEVIARRRAA